MKKKNDLVNIFIFSFYLKKNKNDRKVYKYINPITTILRNGKNGEIDFF